MRIPYRPQMQPEGSGTLHYPRRSLSHPAGCHRHVGSPGKSPLPPAPYLSQERPPDAPQHGRAVPDAGIQPSRLLQSTRRESGCGWGIHPHVPPALPARSHLRGLPGVHGLHDGRVLQLAVDDQAREALGQRILGVPQHVPVIPDGTIWLPAGASLVLQLRQPLVGLLPVIICEGAQGEGRGAGGIRRVGKLSGRTLRVSPTAPAPKVSSLNWSMSSSSSPRAWNASSSSSSGQSSRDWDSRERSQPHRTS